MHNDCYNVAMSHNINNNTFDENESSPFMQSTNPS